MSSNRTQINDGTEAQRRYRPTFSDAVQRALEKWPDVPACFGWLALDARGRWRIGGAPITHAGAIAFLNTHYACDEAGRWFVQNGPQTAYVDLELAPWVLSVAPDGGLATHTGLAVERFGDVFVTPDGEVLVATPLGLAAILDRDLESFARRLRAADGDALVALAGLAADTPATLVGPDGTAHRASRASLDELADRYACTRRPAP
jgi:hypothetical protein